MPLLYVKKVYIRSRRRHHPALRFDSGRVRVDQFENATGYEYWTLRRLGNDMYNISHGKKYSQGSYKTLFLQANRDGEVSCGLSRGYNNFRWKIEYTRKGYVSIKSCFNNKYLCADESFRVTASRECCELWEQWAIVDMPHLLVTPTREVYIRSCQQLSFCNNDGLPALAPSITKAYLYGPVTYDDEVWQVRCIGDNKILLKSDYGFLSSDKYGTIKVIEKNTFTESKGLCWTIENAEGDSINAVALKSEFGRYLCRDNGDHFMGDGSVKADSTGCRDKCAWWVFLTDSDDVNGDTALDKDAITMKDHNIEYT